MLYPQASSECRIALYPQASSEVFVVCENLVLVPDPIPVALDEVWGWD